MLLSLLTLLQKSTLSGGFKFWMAFAGIMARVAVRVVGIVGMEESVVITGMEVLVLVVMMGHG